jgi:hypothetical protein
VHVSRVATWTAASWSSSSVRARVQTVIGALTAGRLAPPIVVDVGVKDVVVELGLWMEENDDGWCVVIGRTVS